MKIYSAKLSDAGMSGKNNEDNCIISTFSLDNGDDAYFAVVADGIGGHNAGELASKIAVEKAQEEFSASDIADPRAAFRRIINDVNLAIYERAQGNPQFNGMGTTLALALVANGELHAAGVGDSRVYRLTKEGKPIQVTLDHTWAQEAIDAGRLTADQARRHPNRNVLKRYLGILPDVEVDEKVLREPQPFREGDALVVCSDGLTDLVKGEEIQQIVNEQNVEAAAKQLIQTANARGGHDNITAIVLKTTENAVTAPATLLAPPTTRSLMPIIIAVLVVLVLVVFGVIGYMLFTRQVGGTGQQVNAGSPTVTPAQTQLPTAASNTETAPQNTSVPVVDGNATSTLIPTNTIIPTNTFTPIPPTRTRTPVPPTSTPEPTQPPISDTPPPTIRDRDPKTPEPPQPTDVPQPTDRPTREKPTKEPPPPTESWCCVESAK